MLGVALDGVAVLLLGLVEVPLVVLEEAAEVVVGVGRAPVQADGLEVVLLRRLVVLGWLRDGVSRNGGRGQALGGSHDPVGAGLGDRIEGKQGENVGDFARSGRSRMGGLGEIMGDFTRSEGLDRGWWGEDVGALCSWRSWRCCYH